MTSHKGSLEPENELYISFALAHLGMLVQAAKGQYKADVQEIDERAAWLVGFFRTGQGIVNDENKAVVQLINGALKPEKPPENIDNLTINA